MDYKKWAGVGVGVGIISYGLAYLYKLVLGEGGAGTLTMATLDVNVKQQITSGVDTSLGGQLFRVFGGNFNNITGGMLGAIIMAIVGAVLLVLVGRFIFEYVPFGKTANTRLMTILLYGSVVGGLVVGFFSGAAYKLPALNVVIAMVIYFFIVAVVYGQLSRTQMVGKFFPIPQ